MVSVATLVANVKLEYSLQISGLVPQRDMSKHTNGVEQTPRIKNAQIQQSFVTIRDDQVSTSLTDSAGATMKTGHKDSNDVDQALLPQGSKRASFDTRNREFLKKLASQNKKNAKKMQ